MTIAVALVSIFALGGLAWLAGKALRASICPVCFGVAGTWLWMLGARYAGFPVDAAMLAVLLGASVVGIAGQLEGGLPQGRSALLWKTLALPLGFVAAYGLVTERWIVVAITGLALVLLAALFLLPRRLAPTDEAAVKKLEQQMKKCC